MSKKKNLTAIAMSNVDELVESTLPEPKDLLYMWNPNRNTYDVIDSSTGREVSSENYLEKAFEKYVYTPMLGMLVAEAIRSGATLGDIENNPRFPSKACIYYWRTKYKEFDIRFQQAFRDRGDYWHDTAIDIALSTTNKEDVPINKLKVDTLKWAAERANPETYGQKKIDIEFNAPRVIVLNTGIDREGAPTIEELLSKKEPITIDAEVVNE